MTQNKIKVPFHIPSDIIEEILFFIQSDDGRTLYSCLLVNRQWCQLVIPRLWNNPFDYARNGNSKLISTIISFLTDTQRKSLINNGITLPRKSSFNQHSTFDYVSKLKHLHYDYMLISVEEWCKKFIYTPGNISFTLIIKGLLRLFVNKSVELKSLIICPKNHVYCRYNLSRYMELLDPEFNGLIKNLKYLHVETYSQFPSVNFFQKFSLIVRNVEKLHLKTPLLGLMRFPNGMEDNMAKSLCKLIQSQHKLKEFKLSNSIRYTTSFISSLSSVHANHLKSISLFETKIDELDSWKALTTSCFNLENLEIINCIGLRYDFILPFYNIVNLKKLQFISLEKNQPSDVNDELKYWVINGYKKDLGDCKFLKNGFDDINNDVINNNNVILNKS